MLKRFIAIFVVLSFVLYSTKYALSFLIPAGPLLLTATEIATTAIASAQASAVASSGITALITAGNASLATPIAGTLLGLTPIGWAGVGVGVLATMMLVADSNNSPQKVAVVVSHHNTVDEDHYDYRSAPGILSGLLATGSMTYPLSDFEKYTRIQTAKTTSDAMARTFYLNSTNLDDALLRVDEEYSCQANYRPNTNNTVLWCDWHHTGDAYLADLTAWRNAGRPGLVRRVYYTGDKIVHPQYGWLGWQVVRDYTCPEGQAYINTNGAGVCMPSDISTLTDAVCRASWHPTTGCPIINFQDPDCGSVATLIVADCGTITMAPSITIEYPPTGMTTSITRPATTSQGQVGSIKVVEKIPDPTTGTTTERVQNIKAPTSTTAPTSTGTTSSTYPGVGANANPATPLASVTVANWPDTQPVAVQNWSEFAGLAFPESMKIDPEIPAEQPTDMPEIPQDFNPETATNEFFQPLKNRLSTFFTIQLPAHTSACGFTLDTGDWQTKVGGRTMFTYRYNQRVDGYCNTLNSHKDLIANIMTAVFTVLSILIILRA